MKKLLTRLHYRADLLKSEPEGEQERVKETDQTWKTEKVVKFKKEKHIKLMYHTSFLSLGFYTYLKVY